MPKYYRFPFATSGTRSAIPDTVQSDGSVSYPTGYGVDYQLDQEIDPAALDVERDKFNELMFDATENLQYLQQFSVPAFITSIDNGGTPYPYSKKAIVRFQRADTTYSLYQSLLDNNQDAPEISPGVFSAQWQEIAFRLYANDTGTVNNVRVFAGSPITVTAVGTSVMVKVLNTNTGSTTIRLGSTESTYTVRTGFVGAYGTLQAGMLLAGNTYEFVFNGTDYVLMNPTQLLSPPPTRPNAPVPHAFVTFSTTQTQIVPKNTTNQVVQFGRTEFDLLAWWDPFQFRFKPSYQGYYDITVTLSYSVDGGSPPITPGEPFQQVVSLRGNQTGSVTTLIAQTIFPATVGDRYSVSFNINSVAFNGVDTYVYVAWTAFDVPGDPNAQTTIGLNPSPIISDVTCDKTCTFGITYRGTTAAPS